MAYDEAAKKRYTQVGHLEALIKDAETNYAKKTDLEHDHEIDAINGLQTALDGKQDKGNYALKSELTSGLAGKADTKHDHDEASETTAGFMGAEDKKKLNGIETATDEDIQAMIASVRAELAG